MDTLSIVIGSVVGAIGGGGAVYGLLNSALKGRRNEIIVEAKK